MVTVMKVLRLNVSGTPTAWISREDAAVLYAKGSVVWEAGAQGVRLHGGTNRLGVRSCLDINPIIAVRGAVHEGAVESLCLSNRMLFRRDRHLCLYCGNKFEHSELTRDHVIPRAQGGPDVWGNVVAACRRCNHFKADRTPEQANMSLLAVPFRPNLFEWMYLSQHNVRADQMDYLEKQFTGRRDWAA